MTMHNCPILTSVVVKQRHQDLRNEATQWQAARVASSANNESTGWPWTPLKSAAASMHAISAHRLSEVTRRVEIRLSAWRTTPSGA
jgi:hypothetical protein